MSNLGNLYHVRIVDHDAATVAYIANARYISYTNRVNGVGSHQIRIDMDDPKSTLFDYTDYIFEIWRKPMYMDEWVKDYSGFNRYTRRYAEKDGALYRESIGRTLEDLLRRRLVEPPCDEDFSSKAGRAEEVIKEYVDENAASGTQTYLVQRSSSTSYTLLVSASLSDPCPVAPPNIFHNSTHTVTYNGGELVFSANDDGSGELSWDDKLDIEVRHGAFVVASWSHTFGDVASITPYGPVNLGRLPTVPIGDSIEIELTGTNLYPPACGYRNLYLCQLYPCEIDAGRQIPNLTIESLHDPILGDYVTRNIRNTRLLDVAQELANAGNVDFWIEYLSEWRVSHEFMFKISDQRGSDRRVGNTEGNLSVVFSLGRGNMLYPSLTTDRLTEINRIYVGGPGKGKDRLVVIVDDEEAQSESPWNITEGFVDSRNDDTIAKLTNVGDENLITKGAFDSFDFDIADTMGCTYGREWFLGDLVTGIFDGERKDVRIVEVTVSIRKDMGETVKVKLETI